MPLETRDDGLTVLAKELITGLTTHHATRWNPEDSALTVLKTAYNNGRSDCLQESADLKKSLLPHELRLISRLLDYASASFAQSAYPSEGSSDVQLDNTKRNREMVQRITPGVEPISETDYLVAKDYTLAKHLAHRVREMLAEENE